MGKSDAPEFVGAMRNVVDHALMAMDVMVRDLNIRPNTPMAAAVEAQREIILSLGRLSELVAEVGETQRDFLHSPEIQAAILDGARKGADMGFKDVAYEMRRRSTIFVFIVILSIVLLGGTAGTAGFVLGGKYQFRTLVADCLQKGVGLTPRGERVCAILMAPKEPEQPAGSGS